MLVSAVVAAPYLIEQLASGIDPTRTAGEIEQKLELLGSKLDRLAPDRCFGPLHIYFQIPAFDRARFIGRRTGKPVDKAEYRLDAGDQFQHAERLGHMMIRPEFQAQHVIQPGRA
jgi:hypothetical protein